MSRSRLLVLLLVLVLPITLAACGDDDDDVSGDEQEIIDAITASATSGDPAACREFQTQRFTEQVGDGETGEAAVKQCEENAADTPADEIEVTNIEIDGDSATAEGAVTGSFFDGQTLDLALVNEGDQWKLDELVGFSEFDRDAFVASFEEGISSEEDVSPEALACVTQQLEAQSDQQLQDFLLGTDPQAEDAIFEPCSKFFQPGE